MADFPAGIRCSGMSYVPGVFPAAAHVSTNGNLVQVRASNKESGARLRIRFINITRTELASIRSHYQGEGTINSWLLSTVLLDGAEYATEISTMRWRYAKTPDVKDITDDVHSVEIELEHVPVLVWTDTYTLVANPATVRVGSSSNLLAQVLPTLWASRLTTTAEAWTVANAGSFGTMQFGASGENFQAFWFPVVGETGVRIAVIKRLSNGNIVWQRWTSAPIGDAFITRDSRAPVVLPMADGGCVVTAQETQSLGPSTGTPPTRTLRMWRIDGTGAEVWKKEYVLNNSGAYRLALNGSNIVVLCATISNLWVSPTVPFNNAAPALLRIAVSDGSYVNGRAYRPVANDASSDNTFPDKNFIVLSNGRIVFKSARDLVSNNLARVYLLEISGDLATVHANAGYSNNTSSGTAPFMRGPIAALPDGGYLSRQDQGFVRFDSSYNITANYRHRINIPNAANGVYDASLLDGNRCAMKIDASGNGYLFGFNFTQSIRAVGVGIVNLANSGASVINVGEIDDGSGAGEFEAPGYGDIDLTIPYGVAQLVGTASTICYVTALGFSMQQPTSTAATATAAGTLDTGSCSNTMTVRGWESPGTSLGSITSQFVKYPITVQSGAITLTSESTGAISMVDASSVLSWTLTRLVI
jgi:hypothetical protein